MYTSTDQEGVLQYEEQGRVVKWKARLVVKGRTQNAGTEQLYVVILSEYESSGRVWRLLRTIYGQVRTLDTDRYLRHIGFVTTENSDYIYEWRSDERVIYIALYIDDLLVTVSECLVKWINANSQQCTDIVNTDTEIMRGFDYRQADESIQSTADVSRSHYSRLTHIYIYICIDIQ